MRDDQHDYDRVIQRLRSQYWQSLPTKAYKLRRLVRKARARALEPGEREEIELLAKRLADSGATYGFDEVSRIGAKLDELLNTSRRAGGLDHDELVAACDDLDRFIDDMTVEALAVRLQAIWR